MTNLRRILLLFAMCSLLFTVYTIQDTMAKYKSDASADANISVARWRILVNNQDIKDNSDFSSTIAPVFVGNNDTASNIIAPNTEGYFDVIIDGSSADVSFNYSLNITVSPTSDVQDLVITSYTVNNGISNIFENSSYTITNLIPYNSNNKVMSYRFFVKWEDTNGTMDNAADTAASDGDALFQVNLAFTQATNQ